MKREAFFAATAAAVALELRADGVGPRTSHFWSLDYGSSDMVHLLVICALSFAADWLVLGYHSRAAPHPKFRLRWTRAAVTAVHIASGKSGCDSVAAAGPRGLTQRV